ncbi:glycosyltransferase family 4 protein [Candidatus Oscillochloris fontis]|uniref:glycosyltransferase family 4 protein n=1 Tax=Candidatus Oscillochloris fontis TaxID=2496868 RepID=UPI00101CA55B|nr:glycosyltransferase family 1 protein [Candidatus Oscillochloris fontis]
MRIGIDARCIGDHFPGIGRYITSLIHTLGHLDHGHQLAIFYNPLPPAMRYHLTTLPGVTFVALRSSPFSPRQQIELPLRIRQLGLDLFHAPYFVRPYLGQICPSVTTIYDLLGRHFPHQLTWRGRLLYRVLLGLAVQHSTMLISISEATRYDLHQHYRIAPERIAVTPLAAGSRFCPQPAEVCAEVRRRYNLPDQYVLYLGSNKPHKNLERLVRAWAAVDHPASTLVLAGHHDPHHPELDRLLAAQATRILRVPNVADADLPALYSAATCFAFVSTYEGFGLPPLEALACGTPVLCSNTSSMPEVVGNAALLVNPWDVGAMTRGLTDLLDQSALREDLRRRGLARAAQFSWQRTAEQTLAVYEHAI